MVMYKIDRRGMGGGDRSLGRTPILKGGGGGYELSPPWTNVKSMVFRLQ